MFRSSFQCGGAVRRIATTTTTSHHYHRHSKNPIRLQQIPSPNIFQRCITTANGAPKSKPIISWSRRIINSNINHSTRGVSMVVIGSLGMIFGTGTYYYYCYSCRDHPIYNLWITTTTTTTGTSMTSTTQCAGSDDDNDDNASVNGATNGTGDIMILLENNEDDMITIMIHQIDQIQSQIYYTYRIVMRCMKLFMVFTPVMVLYPIYYYFSYYDQPMNIDNSHNKNTKTTNPVVHDAHEVVLGSTNNSAHPKPLFNRERFIQYYYQCCLYCVEMSGGATIIKFLQWMSSRPDLFGHEFCHVFCKLQDHTTPHSLQYTEQCMIESYGTNWKDMITLHEIIGSGCIGQVYRGTVKIELSEKDGSSNHITSPPPQYKEVAIKVIHPNVRNDIDTDMDIIRHIITLIQYINPDIQKHCQYLNIDGVLNEFQKLLKLQMDLRYEARNLQRFQNNFKNDPVVQFPQLLYHSSSSSSSSSSVLLYPPNENVLIETFCDGIPILRYCRENHVTNHTQLTKLCYHGIRAVCQMIFLDNFVHGDLHPGNVYVSRDGEKFILFDVGIVNEYSYDDHTVLIDVLSAFIRKDGRKAGRCMIDDSNSKFLAASSKVKADMAVNEEQYIDKIEMLTIKASTEGYFMEHLGTYISYICDAASTHHVMMNPSFVTAALAVKIQEGIALAMDPNCSIPDVAIPIIIESERRRYMSDSTDTIAKKINSSMEYVKRFVFGNDKGIVKK